METNLTFVTTFLEGKGGLRLVKTFKEDGTKIPYPNAKNFTSTRKSYPKSRKGLEARLADMRHYAGKGACILKGELEKDIKEEPRAGLCLTQKPNDTIIFDIDGIDIAHEKIEGLDGAKEADKKELKLGQSKEISGAGIAAFVDETQGKIGRRTLKRIADYIISKFPEKFHNVSYFLHASSSMGVGGSSKVSMHIEFVLDKPVRPSEQKDWLTAQNLTNKFLTNKLQLNATSMGLRLPLDKTVADNSKLIFIGTPFFENARHNPIAHSDRILLIEKDHVALSGDAIQAPMKQFILDQTDIAIKRLRKDAGLKTKARADIRRIKRFGETVEMLKNPDQAQVVIVDDSGDFVHANIGIGDSNAYWWPKSDPTLVYNFKSEPTFRLQDVDKEMYEWCLVNHAEHINSKKSIKYLARRSLEAGKSSGFVTAAINTETNIIYEIVTHTERSSVEDWLEGAGEILGDNVDFMEMVYDPTMTEVYQVGTTGDGRPIEKLNTYIESPVWRKRAVISGDLPTYETITPLLTRLCPSIMFLLTHIMAGHSEDVTHFINWLAFVARYKRKPGTTWLIHGTQGTGKGIFWEKVISPMFGRENIRETDITALEDKFNSSLSSKTMILVDEFRHSEAAGSKRLESKLKQMATQENYAMRGMQKEYADAVNRFNMLFFSNAQDAMRVLEDDRRINIAPRQEVKLREALASEGDETAENSINALVVSIENELQRFANTLHSMEIDEGRAKQPRNNSARMKMAKASRTRSEDFVEAIQKGELSFFYELLTEAGIDDMKALATMKKSLKTMVAHMDKYGRTFVDTAGLIEFHRAATGSDKTTAISLNKFMERHVDSRVEKSRGSGKRGFSMPISTTAETIDEINKL